MGEMIKLYKTCPMCEGDVDECDNDYDGECDHCGGTGFVEHGQVPTCKDHPALDMIYQDLCIRDLDVSRVSAGVEFVDETGRRFEIVVREVDEDTVDLP